MWAYNVHGKKDAPEWTSMFTLSFLIYINILSVPLIIITISDDYITSFPQIEKSIIIIISLFYLAIFYFLLLYNNKYKKIISEFEELKISKRKGDIVAGAYVLITFTIFVLLMVVNL